MQKKISMILFAISIFFLYQSLSIQLSPQIASLCTDSRENIKKPDTFSYQAEELGCQIQAATPSSLYARAYCVLDADSGRLLLGKQENEKMPMASTTKIMTCILALESGKLEETVTVSDYAAKMPDVQLNICEGEQYLLKDLLYSLMLESHNDTAVAIAEHLGGSVEGFAEMMNEKAKELGCVNTHFVTPNGLDDPAHYTTAKELCMIGAYAIQNKEFLKIISTKSYSFSDLSGKRSFTVNNHDAFLSQYSGAIGIKTGFTGNAGYCFCGAAKQKGTTLVSAVLACGWPPNKSYKWSDTKKLMDYGFQGFETKTIPVSTQKIILPVDGGQSHSLSLKRVCEEDVSLPLSRQDQITVTRQLPEKLSAPVRQGDIIGYENYCINGECFLKIPLTASHDIKKTDYGYWLGQLFRLFAAGQSTNVNI